MEDFIRNLSYSATTEDVTNELIRILRRDHYIWLWGPIPVNVEVKLHTRDRRPGARHSGTGVFTVTVETVARRFLQEYGGELPPNTVYILRRPVFFTQSRNQPQRGTLDKIPISGIEFGWECRDSVFSCEWSKSLDPSGSLGCDRDRREFRIVFGPKVIALRFAQINWTSCGMDGSSPVICFNLDSAPIFEEAIATPQPNSSPFARTRISSLDPAHERVVPYASLAVRFICRSRSCLQMFRELCTTINFRKPSDDIYRKEDRQLFSAELEQQLGRWLEQLEFEVAFQVEKIVRDSSVDFREILAIREAVEYLVRSWGPRRTVGVLRSFQSALRVCEWEDHPDFIPDLFLATARDYVPETKTLADMALEETFSCHHVSVTPTAIKFSGPFQEQSNRVFRRYPDHHSCFIRVTLEEETRLQLRFDREVDGAAFVRRRYGTILRETGLKIGGRPCRFLAYSQSALKEHSVWFMRSFTDEDGTVVDTASIIHSLGDFEDSRDPKLISCPGRYGARISQAFTSTYSGVSIQPEEIRKVPDIEVFKTPGDPNSGKWNHTDGVGTVSSELANAINVHSSLRRAGPIHTLPTSFQIRFQGCKVRTLR